MKFAALMVLTGLLAFICAGMAASLGLDWIEGRQGLHPILAGMLCMLMVGLGVRGLELGLEVARDTALEEVQA